MRDGDEVGEEVWQTKTGRWTGLSQQECLPIGGTVIRRRVADNGWSGRESTYRDWSPGELGGD